MLCYGPPTGIPVYSPPIVSLPIIDFTACNTAVSNSRLGMATNGQSVRVGGTGNMQETKDFIHKHTLILSEILMLALLPGSYMSQ